MDNILTHLLPIIHRPVIKSKEGHSLDILNGQAYADWLAITIFLRLFELQAQRATCAGAALQRSHWPPSDRAANLRITNAL